ncbi:MAG: hypothetical protein AMXMBFR53_25630 [Gemmatimonadota bacterium]
MDDASRAGASAPDAIGPYRVVGVLGEGGMGVVYRAEQTDPVRRTVALKVIRRGMDSAKVVARFEAERQALAVMDHPSIAKVLDAGTTDDGLPFFAMELVEGLPLTRFADEHRLTVRERVELFGQVCRAVQHAHGKGVIHRDLKPSNVMVSLVDGRPLCRVIDFGIAKAVEADVEAWAHLTHADDVLGTPAYMSPEQLGSTSDVDVRSDLYALGIILYELLAGTLPFEDDAYRGLAAYIVNLRKDAPRMTARLAALDDTQVTVADARRTDPAGLRRQLRGDLEWIVARATDPERDRRYETANGLALELDRYLAGQPVLAGPPGASYRVGKFVRRHTVGVAFSAASVVALAAVGVWQTVQAERIRQARDLADARREQAEGVLDFMLTDLREKLEPLGQLEIMDGVGEQAMAYFATLPEDAFSEQELLSRSQALYQIGSVRLDQGRIPAADTAFQESLRLAAALSARDPDNTDWLFGVGQAEFWAGEAARRRGDLAGALLHFERYRDLSAGLSARDTANMAWLLEVGYSHTNVGAILLARGDLVGAAGEMARSLEVKQVVSDASGGDPRRVYDLARGHYNLALVQEDLGRFGEALESLRRDAALKRSLLEASPANAVWLTTLADSEYAQGRIHVALGAVDSAAVHFTRSLELISGVSRRDPANARWLRSVGTANGGLARVEALRGRAARALELERTHVAILEEAVRRAPDQRGWAVDLAGARGDLGERLREDGDLRGALESGEAAVAALEALSRDDPSSLHAARNLVSARIHLGETLLAAGDDVAARAQWERALETLESTGARETTEHQPLSGLVRVLVLLNRPEEARPYLQRLRGFGYADPGLEAILAERSPLS